MTLIIGIKCSDGVVFGADSAGSITGLTQLEVKKLFNIGNDILLGASGNSITTQVMKDCIENMLQANSTLLSGNTIGQALSQCIWNTTREATMRAEFMRKQFPNTPVVDPSSASLIGVRLEDTVRLFCVEHGGGYFEVTSKQIFHCTGSGMGPAFPFLSLLKRILWTSELPTVQEAIFATIWTLDHSIQAAPGGIGLPIQISTLFKKNGHWEINEFDEESFTEDLQRVRQLEKEIGTSVINFIQSRNIPNDGAPDVPEPATCE